MNDMAKTVLLWVVIAVVLLTVFQSFNPQAAATKDIPYSEFMQAVRDKRVDEVLVHNDGRTVEAKLQDGSSVRTTALLTEQSIGDIEKDVQKVKVEATDPPMPLLLRLLFDWLPLIVIFGLIFYFMRQMQSGGGGRGAMSFGRSRAKLQGEDQIKVTFADVAGCDEAKEEVSELVEFLRDPGKFTKLGGKIPRGVLMVGSPGTGKTLLAKAIAGEAKVPFFSISGSDFVEMFVGVG
ncbi:MAG TPA: ATP-dependent metallopeptidase FtsH/Yme1/Tma family protein, partial [Dokdonella sp.]|nr:ATP-dependent metallopeptidase FtsH/Yme1/Tma family protein [Dokdonella sp.]